MQVESSIEPKVKFEIENHVNGKVDVVFFCNIKKVKDEECTKYKYDTFRICIQYRSDIQEEIEKNYNNWLDFAKDCEYEKLAAEIREKRNKLLEESDKYMILDRLTMNFPQEISLTNVVSVLKDFFKTLSNIKNGSWAKYRQELRDLPNQKGFPYDVKFPDKPEE